MRLTLLLVCLVVALAGYSQTYINDYKPVVRMKLKRLIKENHFQSTITETDSTIALIIRDSAYKPVDFVYHFNKNRKCIAEEYIGRCEPCMKLYLGNALKLDKYEWVKVNEQHYVSKYSKGLMIEISNNPDTYSFIIYKMDWDRELYERIIHP